MKVLAGVVGDFVDLVDRVVVVCLCVVGCKCIHFGFIGVWLGTLSLYCGGVECFGLYVVAAGCWVVAGSGVGLLVLVVAVRGLCVGFWLLLEVAAGCV